MAGVTDGLKRDLERAKAVAPTNENSRESPQLVATRDGMTAESWAPQLHEAYGRTLKAIIAFGQLLIAAKKKLEFNGQWLRLFSSHTNPVAQPMEISEDTAERWMAIARHPVLANSANWRSPSERWACSDIERYRGSS